MDPPSLPVVVDMSRSVQVAAPVVMRWLVDVQLLECWLGAERLEVLDTGAVDGVGRRFRADFGPARGSPGTFIGETRAPGGRRAGAGLDHGCIVGSRRRVPQYAEHGRLSLRGRWSTRGALTPL